ncbi:PepSY-associated TM helix domain-containing protein [Luteibacter sp. 9135]|uniref:PepSY-associated TM helix domain-containing protein n=1 Tax=Luteibacter sp. 9135 TaxID=1500893 RepID=UPI00056AEDA6|nr:PepSY domain-containing protein [Luteibacter sp. 9135]
MTHAATSSSRATYRLIWRWHFYAGLFCLPFIVWLATTGMIYLFKPQIEPFLERQYAHVTQGPARPASVQVAAALAAVPGTVLNAYELPSSPTAATRVLVGKGAHVTRVFVDPSSAKVLGVVGEDDRFMRVIFYLHGELLLGTKGSMLVELAASWTILMLLSGLYLWWPRGGRLMGTLVPRLNAGGRVFWRDLHAVTGFWISLMALFLLVSGLPWSKSWGGLLQTVRQTYAASAAAPDWTIGSAAERATNRAANTPIADEHAMHHGMAMDHGMAMNTLMGEGPDYAAIDRLVPTVAALALPPPVLIAPPSKLKPTWTARSDTQNRPQRVDVGLDAATGAVTSRTAFADRPLLDRLIGYGVAIHEGQLFAPLNQILGVVTALGLLMLSTSAVVLWWRRRPAGTLGAPPAHAGVRYPALIVAVLVVLGLLLPLLGVTMVLVLLIERWLLRRFPSTRHLLGLSGPPVGRR